MTLETKCNGCGKREDADTPMNLRTIHPSIFTVSTDDRDQIPDEVAKSHLCPNCVGEILHNYFGRPAQGKLEVPAFLQATARERARAMEH